MPKFLTPLQIELIGKQKYKLISPLVYESYRWRITLLIGFTCDSLSKPEVLWSIVGAPFGDEDTWAGFIHDALYRSQLFDRRMCDYQFYEALLSCNVPKMKARAMYYAVRAGGESAYRERLDVSGYRDLVLVEING